MMDGSYNRIFVKWVNNTLYATGNAIIAWFKNNISVEVDMSGLISGGDSDEFYMSRYIVGGIEVAGEPDSPVNVRVAVLDALTPTNTVNFYAKSLDDLLIVED